MAYVDQNFKTKKALREAIKNGEDVRVLPNMFGGNDCYKPGKAAIEGPWFPAAHSWYADVTVDKDMKVLKVK